MEFSHRDVPWAKSGVSVIDRAVTAAEAAELGGLNFEVELWPVSGNDPESSESVEFPGRFVAVRTDTKVPLAVVGSKYHTLNYGEAFDFIDEISPTYVAAGIRRGGREGYLVAQAPEYAQVDLLGGDDPTTLYLVLRTSHDASKKCEVSILDLRNKCTNMLSLRGFMSGAKHRWGVGHTATMPEKLAEAKESLQNIGQYVHDLQDTAERLAAIDVEIEEARRILEWVLPNRPKRPDNIRQILDLYQTSPTNGYPGTGWGFINALTEWLDWGRTSNSADARFISGLAGYGHKQVNRVAGRLLSRGN